MSRFTQVVWPVCVAAALALSGCVVDTTESEESDEELTAEVLLQLEGNTGEGEDDGTEDERGSIDDDGTTQSDTGAVAVPHAEPDPEPWDPGDGHGSDDT